MGELGAASERSEGSEVCSSSWVPPGASERSEGSEGSEVCSSSWVPPGASERSEGGEGSEVCSSSWVPPGCGRLDSARSWSPRQFSIRRAAPAQPAHSSEHTSLPSPPSVRVQPRLVAALLACLLLSLFPSHAGAGTTGRISGRVLDAKRQPLVGANIIVVGVPLGAASDADGRYTIVNVPAGTYSVKASLIGHAATTITGVVVSADLTTTVDVTLQEAAVQLQEVVVSAERPVVELNLTHNVATVTKEQITKLPVQELQDVVNIQAGVVDGHFRGGRKGEVQWQVDGVTMNNVFDNTATVKLDRSVLEEVQVISGTFDAEYGQAMSGVVNAVLRRGTERFAWSGETLFGSYAYELSRRFIDDGLFLAEEGDPSRMSSAQFTVSGPTGLPRTVFLANGRWAKGDDYRRGMHVFNPTDRRDSLGQYHPTGDGSNVPLGDVREWSGLLKLSNRSLPGIVLDYQAVTSFIDAKRIKWAFRVLPDGAARQETRSLVHGLDWTQTLSATSYYKLSLRQNLIDYHDRVYDDLYDPRYDAAGEPQGDPNVLDGAYTQGVEFTRYVQRTNTPVLAGSFSTQIRRDQFVKLGGEVQHPHLEFGSDGHLVFTQEGGRETLVRRVNEPPDYPGLVDYRPWMWAAYAQDEVDFTELRLRGGLRLEYFDPMATIPGDLANPANAIPGAPTPPPKTASRKYSLMPRIGVSYPVTKESSVFFAYGHFTQMPPLGDIYSNADYSVLRNLQAGDEAKYGVLGNPDVKPEKTVQYQFGWRQGVADVLGVDLTVFYKDIRSLLGVEFISTYNGAEYPRLTNVDFGNVIGLTLALDQRPIGPFRSTLDYTWQTATGNSSDPRETATRAEAGEDPRPRQIPLNWDQRHSLNLTMEMSRLDRYALGAVLRLASGQPYTPTIALGFGGGLEANSGRKPAALLLDLRGEYQLALGGMTLGLVGRGFNLFDTRFFNGFVFASTGNPYTTRDISADRVQLGDPGRYYGPRRFEVGVTVASRGRP